MARRGVPESLYPGTRPTWKPAAASGSLAAVTGTDIRGQELAAFLRSRRERVTPEQVGLPRGTRRRTPGLRREEVAQLSSVGVTWYTWLERYTPRKTYRLARA